MGFRYIPKDMIRRSDFSEWFAALPAETKKKTEEMVAGFIEENPGFRLSPLTGPGYFMMHWLMADLYTSLAIYLVLKSEGAGSGELLENIDRCLTDAGKKLNRLMRRLMKLPGAFWAARNLMPKAMTLANGHGFQVTAVDCGNDAFGFDVTECPYFRLYKKYNAPEIGPVLCRFDDTLGSRIEGLEFIRKGTLCRGDSKCDFLYKRTNRSTR